MAGDNEVLVKFKGDNDDLKKKTKQSKEDIDGVKKSSDETDESLKRTGNSGSQAGDKIGKGFKIAAAAVAAVAVGATVAVGKLATDSIKAFAEYEQLVGGMQKIFNDIDYSKIAADANNAYATMNISASQYMSQIAGVGSAFAQSMGDEKGYETAKQGMQAIADFASGTGKDVDYLMGKYQAITKATTSYATIADQFAGILPATSADFLKQAQAAGFLEKKYTDLTKVPITEYQAAVTSMLEKGVGDMGLLGNTVAETAETISGSLNATKASWQNVMSVLASGDDNAIETALNGLIESAGNFVGNISGILPNVLTGVTGLITSLVEKIPDLLKELLPAFIEGVVSVLEGLVDAIPDLIDVLTEIIPDLVDGLVKIFSSVLDALPEIVEGFIELFQALGEALTEPDMLKSLVEGISEAMTGMLDAMVKMMEDPAALEQFIEAAILLFTEIVKALPQIIGALAQMTPAIIKALVAFLTEPENLKMIGAAMLTLGWELIKAIPLIIWEMLKAWGTLIPGIGGIFSAVGEWIKGVWDGIVEWAKGVPAKIVKGFEVIKEGIKNAFQGAVDGAKDIFKKGINWIIDQINKLIKGANKVAGVLSKIPGVGDIKFDEIKHVGMAQGGFVSGAGTGTSDSIPARLSNGEFVLRASAVKNIGLDNLQAMNQGQTPRGDAPLIGQIIVPEGADPMAFSQYIGAQVRFA